MTIELNMENPEEVFPAGLEILKQQYPLFETDLSFPEYPGKTLGKWEIQNLKLCVDHGYHTGLWLVQNLFILFKQGKTDPKKPETWMSPSPHAVESQEACCRYARGNTVIMGLGWVAVNTALNLFLGPGTGNLQAAAGTLRNQTWTA